MISGEGDHGTTVFKKFENPLYVNLARNRVASIGIRLCNERGETIRFISGTEIRKMSGDYNVVLPLNTKTDIFQDNKTGDYEISLPRAMEFGGATYEVALCEIHSPHTWLNIKPPMLSVTFTALENEKMWGERHIECHRKIDEGYYETV